MKYIQLYKYKYNSVSFEGWVKLYFSEIIYSYKYNSVSFEGCVKLYFSEIYTVINIIQFHLKDVLSYTLVKYIQL